MNLVTPDVSDRFKNVARNQWSLW